MTCDDDFMIFSSLAPIEKLIVVKNGGGYVLICSSSTKLFLYSVNDSVVNRDIWSNAEILHRWELNSPIVGIIRNDKIFVILEDGAYWKLESADGSCLDDNDIFDMEDSPETIHSWKLEDVKYLPNSPTVLSSASTKLGICVIALIDNFIQMFLINGNIVSSSTINHQSSSAYSCVVNISCLSFDFMNLWLPHVERANEFLFVGLSDGSVFCFPLALPLKSYCIYRSVHSIVSLSWYQDRNSDRFDSLTIVLDSGAVIRLTPIGEEVSYPFLPFLYSAEILNNFIVSLGECNTRILPMSDISNVCKSFPITDVLSACAVSENNKVILVCDRNSHVYLIDLENNEYLNVNSSKSRNVVGGTLPRIYDLEKLISSSMQLSKINLALKNHDEYLRTKSLISRAGLLNKHFFVSVKLVQILGNDHTIRINVSFNLPGIVFSKDFWKLDVIVSTMTSTNTYRQKLLSNLSIDRNLIQLVTIPLSFDILFNFECKLTSFVQAKKTEFCLPLGVVEMNASYFLFPPSVKELSAWDQYHDPFWNSSFKFCLELPLKEVPDDTNFFLSQLISDSKALWRYSEWKKMLSSCKVSCIFFGYNVEIRIEEKIISIKGFNLKACLAVRLALFMKLNKNHEVEFKEHLAQCLTSFYQAENIMKICKNPQEFVTDLYNIFKTFNSIL